MDCEGPSEASQKISSLVLDRTAQSDSDVPGYLQTAFKCFGDILQTCDKTLPLTPENELKTIWNDGADFFQAYGRTKQSPA
jgi:hypothetical protein